MAGENASIMAFFHLLDICGVAQCYFVCGSEVSRPAQDAFAPASPTR
jgi:hypothetical protein